MIFFVTTRSMHRTSDTGLSSQYSCAVCDTTYIVCVILATAVVTVPRQSAFLKDPEHFCGEARSQRRRRGTVLFLVGTNWCLTITPLDPRRERAESRQTLPAHLERRRALRPCPLVKDKAAATPQKCAGPLNLDLPVSAGSASVPCG